MDEAEDNKRPFLTAREEEGDAQSQYETLLRCELITPNSSSFVPNTDDIPPINNVGDFSREFVIEVKKLWYLAGPAIFTSICQYSLGAITQVSAGHVGTLALAAVSVENSVTPDSAWASCNINQLGMGSALETLCGQVYGAGKVDMLGVYMQRSWVILLTTALMLRFLFIFAEPFLKAIGQTKEISEAAGVFSIWMIPQLFAYAVNFPIAKFLQAQSKMGFMALIAAVALIVHTVLSWLCGTCGRAWSGFSWQAFHSLWGFVRLSVASAVMLCMNIVGWAVMVANGMNAATSVRVSNELGAAHPRTAKFSLVVLVAVITSSLIGLFLALILIIERNNYPSLFTNDTQVETLVKQLTPVLALCILINNVQPVLSGVAIGAGWQAAVAYVNIGCYYLFGIPLGLLMGYRFSLGVPGIWYGMLSGTVAQTLVLFWMIFKTNWNKEASVAEERIKKWGGHSDSEENHIGS